MPASGHLSGIEFSTSYDLKQVWFVSPTVSALYGSQWGEGNDETYAYWNAGLTLGMSQKPVLSFDIRYWDTDLKDCIDASAYQCGPGGRLLDGVLLAVAPQGTVTL